MADPGDEPEAGPAEAGLPGARIVAASWTGTTLFAATATAAWAGVDAFDDPSIAVALGEFALGLAVWAYAFGKAMARSAAGDDVTLSGLFFLVGAPTPVQVQLLGSLAVSVAFAALTASAEPFGVMQPVLPLALAGAWGARHGRYRPRRDVRRRGAEA